MEELEKIKNMSKTSIKRKMTIKKEPNIPRVSINNGLGASHRSSQNSPLQ